MLTKFVRKYLLPGLLMCFTCAASVYAGVAEQIGRIDEIIARSELGQGDAGLESLMSYRASLEAERKGDKVSAWRYELEAFRLAQKEFDATGRATLDETIGRNFLLIPGQIAMAAQQASEVPYQERLDIAISASLYQPERVWCGLYLIQIMEERFQYDDIIEYCEKRTGLGHSYYRVLRAKMLVQKQLELNHIALEDAYGDGHTLFEIYYELYSPTIREQELSIQALSEIRAILQESGANFVLDCQEIVQRIFAVSWLPESEVIEVLDLCVEAVTQHIGLDGGAGMIQELERLKEQIQTMPAKNMDSYREVGERSQDLHAVARRDGELLDPPPSGWKLALDTPVASPPNPNDIVVEEIVLTEVPQDAVNVEVDSPAEQLSRPDSRVDLDDESSGLLSWRNFWGAIATFVVIAALGVAMRRLRG